MNQFADPRTLSDLPTTIKSVAPSYSFLPARPDTSGLYIPSRLVEDVFRWLLLRAHEAKGPIRAPLFLGIGGPPGEGKSRMIEIVCRRHGCDVFLVSGSQLAGEHEGDATKLLNQACEHALQRSQQTQQLVVVILENFHCSVVATRSHVSYSVNSQLLEGCLLDMADTLAGKRVAIILVSNDFTPFSSALLRDGRMELITWKATRREKVKMVSAMLGSGTGILSRQLLNLFVSYYHMRGRPIAFFEQVRNDAVQESMPRAVLGNEDIVTLARSFEFPTTINFRALLRSARRRHARKPQSFLAGR